LQRQLRAANVTIDVKISRSASQAINGLTARLNVYSKAAANAAAQSQNLGQAVQKLSNIFATFAINAHMGVAALKQFNSSAKSTSSSSKHIQVFSNRFELLGDRIALSAKRFGAFMLAARPLIAISRAFDEAVSEAAQFQDQMVRLSQITGGKTIRDVAAVSKQIMSLSTSLGVSSKDLTGIADTLLQAGLKANETRLALEALAKVALAPTFDSIEQAGEGLIAMMGQFNIPAEQFSKRLSQINTLSAKYAAESSDYITAVRKAGASFSGAGGNMEELLALFTAVRDSSRESADTIATSFRTIFARLQRPGTVNFLEQLGIQLRDVQGDFVGPFQAILNIADKLSKISPQSQLFAQIVEEIGGIRQVNKVQTLLQQTAKAREALSVAQNAGSSIDEDAEKRQQSLIVNLTKLNEAFKNLFKTIATDTTFVAFANNLLKVATAAVQAVEKLTPLLPLIAAFSAYSVGKSFGSLATGAFRRFKTFAGGGEVGGSGNKDSEPAMLMPGEFVLNKKAVKAIGVENLHRFNEGRVGKYAKGTPRNKTYSSFQDFTKGFIEEMGLTKDQGRRLAKSLGVTSNPPRPFSVGGKTYVTGSQMAQGYGDSNVLTDQLSVSKKQNEVIEQEVKTREKAIRSTQRTADALKAQRREEENLLRGIKNGNIRYTQPSSRTPDSWYSNSSYRKMTSDMGRPGTSLVVAGPAYTSTTRGTVIPPPPSGFNQNTRMTRYAYPMPNQQPRLALPNPYAGLSGPSISTHPMFNAVPISSRPKTKRPISMSRRFNRLRSRLRTPIGTLNARGLLSGGNVGGAALLGGIAAASQLDQSNPFSAGFTSALTTGGATLVATGNPYAGLTAAAVGAGLGYSSAKRDNKFKESAEQLRDVFGSSKGVKDLSEPRKAIVDNLMGARITKGDNILSYFGSFFGPENQDYNYKTSLEGKLNKATGARLKELQPDLEIKASEIENKIKELSAKGFTEEQIAKQVDLKNAAFIMGGARATNFDVPLRDIERDGRKITADLIKLNKPLSNLAQKMQEMAEAVDNDIQSFKDLADNLSMAADGMSLIVNSSKVIAGGLGQTNLGGPGTLLSTALNGNASNPAVQNALFNTLGAFGSTGNKLATQLTDTDISEKILSNLLGGKLQGMSDTGNIDTVVNTILGDFQKQFEQSTGRRVDNTVLKIVEAQLDESIANKDTVADFKRKANDPGFTDSLFKDLRPVLEDQKKKMIDSVVQIGNSFESIMDEIDKNIQQRFDMVEKGVAVTTNIDLMKRQFARNDLVDPALLQRSFLSRQGGLLAGAGINANPLDANSIIAGRDALRQQVHAAQKAVEQSGPKEMLSNIKNLKELNTALSHAEKAVSNLTDNMDELNKGPLERLAQIDQEKNARVGFGERLIGGSAVDNLQQLQRIMAAQSVIGRGNFNGLNQRQRQLALGGLNDLSGFRINGKLVDDIKADLIKNTLPGLIPKDLMEEERDLQKQVIDNLGIQAQAIQGNIASLDFNTTALDNNSIQLQNMAQALMNRPAAAGFANGGKLPITTTDSVLAALTPGEMVINKRQTEKFYPLLHKINSGAIDPDDIQFAARGKRLNRKERLQNLGRLPRNERMALRRGLPVKAFDRHFGNGAFGPFRENRQFRQSRIDNFGNIPNGPTRYSRATQRRIARRQRMGLRGYASGGIVQGYAGGGLVENNNINAPWIGQFVSASQSLASAISSIPSEISLVGSYTVHIIHNGLDVLNELQPMVQRMIDDGLRTVNKNYRGMQSQDGEVFRSLDSGLS
jgi:TP901 family phage tail tape measure protein